jgi:hypothetical protein
MIVVQAAELAQVIHHSQGGGTSSSGGALGALLASSGAVAVGVEAPHTGGVYLISSGRGMNWSHTSSHASGCGGLDVVRGLRRLLVHDQVDLNTARPRPRSDRTPRAAARVRRRLPRLPSAAPSI